MYMNDVCTLKHGLNKVQIDVDLLWRSLNSLLYSYTYIRRLVFYTNINKL